MNNAELIEALRNCSSPTVGSCMDCPYYKGVSCKWQMMEDAADALEAADAKIVKPNTKCADLQSQINSMENEIEELLPKEGEWIDEQRGRWIYAKCNLCGKVQDVRSNYCSSCGAKMDGKENADG